MATKAKKAPSKKETAAPAPKAEKKADKKAEKGSKMTAAADPQPELAAGTPGAPGADAEEMEEQEEAAAAAGSAGGGSAEALAAATGPTEMSASFKNFRHHPDMENFYRFIYENDLRAEALTIIDEIMSQKANRKAIRLARAQTH